MGSIIDVAETEHSGIRLPLKIKLAARHASNQPIRKVGPSRRQVQKLQLHGGRLLNVALDWVDQRYPG